MFDRQELERVVQLQQKSYLLLKWLRNAIIKKFISPAMGHEFLKYETSMKYWFKEHYKNIPENCRPGLDEIDEFANIFTSYLKVSFDFVKNPGKVPKSDCGCNCFMCLYIGNAPHLKTKKISINDRKRAEKLKRNCLEQLILDLNAYLPPEKINSLLKDKKYKKDLSILAYASDLIGRSKGIIQGGCSLALWRQFAWLESGSPDRKFKFELKRIIDAEDRIIETVKSMSISSGK